MRREAYLGLLRAEDAFRAFLLNGGRTDPASSTDRFNALMDSFFDAMAEVSLVGTDAVVAAARELRDTYFGIAEDLTDNRPFWDQIDAALEQRRPAMRASRDALLEAMRADVSPTALFQRPG